MSIIQTRRQRVVAGTGITVNNAGSSSTVAIDAAVQTDQETATSVAKVVVPGVQQFHPSAAKCWAYVTVSGGTPTLAASYNITSITDSGVGDLTITIGTDFSSANWASVTEVESVGAVGSTATIVKTIAKAAGSIEFITFDTGGTARDPSIGYSFAGFGDQ